MIINLQIDNIEKLPPGTPSSFRASAKGFEIGREDRDWTLPDPDKFISGRHCEVRFQQDAFWLHDLSRNGTFVNRDNQRLSAPHRLADGDRIRIGRYVVRVALHSSDPASNANDLPSVASERSNVPRPQPTGAATGPDLGVLQAIAAAAGLDPALLSQRPPQEVAADIGRVLRIAVEEVSILLKARAAAKVLVRNNQRTMISATGNNPLKFLPSVDEMLEVLFARQRPGYLGAKESFEEAFRDLKAHEIATYSAMQSALARLLDDLSPETIARRVPPSSFGSMKAKSWDAVVAAWRSREDANENGLLDVFLAYFSEAYGKPPAEK